MAECCLMADTVQWFKDNGIPFFPRAVVTDVLNSIGGAHISGDFHRIVAGNPEKYFVPQPYLKDVLDSLKNSGKKLIFVSNSPFWYVDAGMKHAIGPNWRETWDAVIVSAGKPNFYTDDGRPFREVSSVTGRIKFKKIDKLIKGEVYCDGSIKELTRCLSIDQEAVLANGDDSASSSDDGLQTYHAGGGVLISPNVLYIGDSLFADLVDAKREFGWTTAIVCPELSRELAIQNDEDYLLAEQTMKLLLQVLRRSQAILGYERRSLEDNRVLDGLERRVSEIRDRQNKMLGNTFGSIFRARYQPSLFASSIRRYCDMYMSSVECLRHYSPEHRFYPQDARLLGHEPILNDAECWDIDDTSWDMDVQ
uniref:5'-nucleotidase n=2 Tax=Corethron hystrix TaxID=216773 RepID=A0A6U5EBC8_9STRA|mmetsp:Transcript_16982/g.38203  ORF Transcript_16982/g.38203 Transcript_16982/m.38203 type:complete len:365 (+) Transcript_16982:1168-2262(+)